MNKLVKLYHQMGSPPTFYRFSGALAPWLLGCALLLGGWALYDGLLLAPEDYQQKDAYRIIFVHASSAWMSMMIYAVVGLCGLIAYIWRIKVAEALMIASLPVGTAFTAITLLTGMMWGKPMWGTYWDWDARMTSELVLLFLYFGLIALHAAYAEDPRKAARITALVAIIGLVNLPVIHYSVKWWSSIHQGTTVSLFKENKMPWSMLRPLLVMALACKFYYGYSLLSRARLYLLNTEMHKKWVADVAQEQRA